jgi:hypothetical protein
MPLLLLSLLSTADAGVSCPAWEVAFDGACRDYAWFDANLDGGKGNIVQVLGVSDTNAHPDPGGAVLMVKTAPAAFEYRFIFGTQLMISLPGPSMGGYDIRSLWTTSVAWMPALQRVESVVRPLAGLDADGFPTWRYETVHVADGTYRSGGAVLECDPRPNCTTGFSESGRSWGCAERAGHLNDAVRNSCLTGLPAAAHLSGLFVPGTLPPGSLTVLEDSSYDPIGALEDLCLLADGDNARAWVAKEPCEGRPAVIAPLDPPEYKGCLDCKQWGTETYEGGPYNTDDYLTYVEAIVCVDWEYDFTGTDANGDGWCD